MEAVPKSPNGQKTITRGRAPGDRRRRVAQQHRREAEGRTRRGQRLAVTATAEKPSFGRGTPATALDCRAAVEAGLDVVGPRAAAGRRGSCGEVELGDLGEWPRGRDEG